MKSKCMSIVLSVLLSVSVFAVPVVSFADSGSVRSSSAAVSDNQENKCGLHATWSIDNNGTLRISGTGDVYLRGWENELNAIKSVVVEDGITALPENAFYHCANLQKATLSNGMTEVPDFAFNDCKNLEYFVMPSRVKKIGGFAFEGCESLTSIYIPDTVEEIEGSAFSNCINLRNVAFSSNAKLRIQNRAFANCTSLSEVVIPEGVRLYAEFIFSNCTSLTSVDIKTKYSSNYLGPVTKDIPDYTFDSCTNLKTIKLPSGIRSIGMFAFKNCSSLNTIDIPASVIRIDTGAFLGCVGLTETNYLGSETDFNEKFIKNVSSGNDYLLKNINIEDETPDPSDYSGFSDVSDSSLYYFEPVYWAVKNNITKGISANAFGPSENCSRAQIVAFLYRMYGSPEVNNSVAVFDDVNQSDYYYDAVQWALSRGITSGTSERTFSPDSSCTRAQAVTFMWRAAGKPSAQEKTAFFDIVDNAYYASAVSWAYSTGVASGTSSVTFSPDDICTRAQIVTFLYRARDILK